MVGLSPAVDVRVIVTILNQWSGPAGTTVTPTSTMMESLTRYTVMASVDAARTGSYTCQASIDSSSCFVSGSEVTSASAIVS